MLNPFIIHWTGSAIRVGDIERIGPIRKDKSGRDVRSVYMRDKTSIEQSDVVIDDIMMLPMQIMPALPGTSLVRTFCGDGLPGEVSREPAIGWAICHDGEVRIITANGVNSGSGPDVAQYAEMPDGSVQGIGQYIDPCSFENADAMLAYFGARDKSGGGQ